MNLCQMSLFTVLWAVSNFQGQCFAILLAVYPPHGLPLFSGDSKVITFSKPLVGNINFVSRR